MTDKHICDCEVIHEEAVNEVRGKLCPTEEYLKLGELFKMFADGTRVRILHALEQREMCVCDLSALLNMTQSAISHQLRLLKVSRIVKSRKQGRIVYYSLDDSHIAQIFAMGFDHVMEEREG